MRTRDFEKLKAGDRVIVTGTQDDRTFSNEPGTIDSRGSDRVTIRFYKWDRGWGTGACHWTFNACLVRKFNITVIPKDPKVEPALPWANGVKVETTVLPPVKKRPHGKQEYRGNGKHDWETVVGNTVRLRIPGGWLYGTRASFGERRVLAHRQFVPVPQTVGYPI